LPRSLFRPALLLVFVLAFTARAGAQNPDLMLSQAERDSVLKTYHNIFPIWGRKVLERGFDLPKPLGVNVFGITMKQGIDITDLGLSTGSNPIVPIEFIQFGKNTSTVSTVSGRVDLWLFPFLNVYGFGGKVWANTTVELVEPVAFTSSVDQTGSTLGIGMTGAMGIKRNFLSVDVNWSWSKLEKLTEPVNGRVLSLRYGRNIKLSSKQRLAVWVGAMNQKFASETNGSIRLGDVVPPATADSIRNELENIDQSEWYQNLGPVQKAVVDQVVEKLLSGNAGDTTINYQLNKAPSTPWNMLIGSNLDLNKRWSVRAEAGLIGRTSVLVSAVYRLDL
jgi:hypothetical protein